MMYIVSTVNYFRRVHKKKNLQNFALEKFLVFDSLSIKKENNLNCLYKLHNYKLHNINYINTMMNIR